MDQHLFLNLIMAGFGEVSCKGQCANACFTRNLTRIFDEQTTVYIIIAVIVSWHMIFIQFWDSYLNEKHGQTSWTLANVSSPGKLRHNSHHHRLPGLAQLCAAAGRVGNASSPCDRDGNNPPRSGYIFCVYELSVFATKCILQKLDLIPCTDQYFLFADKKCRWIGE